jgi:hypothetical protein
MIETSFAIISTPAKRSLGMNGDNGMEKSGQISGKYASCYA